VRLFCLFMKCGWDGVYGSRGEDSASITSRMSSRLAIRDMGGDASTDRFDGDLERGSLKATVEFAIPYSKYLIPPPRNNRKPN
jgi:hypothetical protein